MRSFLFGSALALAVLVPASAHAQAGGQKFAFVNTQLILQSAPGATEAQAQFQKDVESLRGQVQTLSDSLAALEAEFTKAAPALSPTVREARLKSLTEKKTSFEQRAEQLNQQAEQRQFDLMQPIMDNVRKALDDLRVEGGYSFIFDVANSSFNVAADKNLDVTERVIAKLRTMGKATVAPTAGPTTRPAGVQARPPVKPPTR
jgi:outer membrane protein